MKFLIMVSYAAGILEVNVFFLNEESVQESTIMKNSEKLQINTRMMKSSRSL
jgi:hypothetical protein